MTVIFVLLLIFNDVIKAQTVKVVAIPDGDTFTALFADNHTERIRLRGIDCPERSQPFGKAAKQFTSSLIFQKKVFLIKKEIDRYGRDYMRSVASEQGYQRYLDWRARNEAYLDTDVEMTDSEAETAGAAALP